MAAPAEVPVEIGRVADFARFTGPLRYDLPVVRGDSLAIVFRLYRAVDSCGHTSGPQVLTDMVARAVIRKALDDPYPYTLTATVDEASGRVTVSADAITTRGLPDYGVWDLELSDGTDALRKTIAQGSVEFIRDVAS